MTTNFIKNIVNKKITEEVHNAFTRYSVGEFVKEPLLFKVGKDITVAGGFEYLNFFHRFVAEKVKGDVQISGTIETVKELNEILKKLGLNYSLERRFGKPGAKYVLEEQKVSSAIYKKMVDELFSEYLLFNVAFTGGLLKVKNQTTPKLGSPTEKFVTLKLPLDWIDTIRDEYLFDLGKDKFSQATVEQTYFIEDIVVDKKLMAKDANSARKKAVRSGEIHRKIMVDGKIVKDYKIKFKV